jgi:hypothetical protein
VVGGWLFNTFGAAGVTGLNLYSLLVAVVLLVVYHAIRRVSSCLSRYTFRGTTSPIKGRMIFRVVRIKTPQLKKQKNGPRGLGTDGRK